MIINQQQTTTLSTAAVRRRRRRRTQMHYHDLRLRLQDDNHDDDAHHWTPPPPPTLSVAGRVGLPFYWHLTIKERKEFALKHFARQLERKSLSNCCNRIIRQFKFESLENRERQIQFDWDSISKTVSSNNNLAIGISRIQGRREEKTLSNDSKKKISFIVFSWGMLMNNSSTHPLSIRLSSNHKRLSVKPSIGMIL